MLDTVRGIMPYVDPWADADPRQGQVDAFDVAAVVAQPPVTGTRRRVRDLDEPDAEATAPTPVRQRTSLSPGHLGEATPRQSSERPASMFLPAQAARAASPMIRLMPEVPDDDILADGPENDTDAEDIACDDVPEDEAQVRPRVGQQGVAPRHQGQGAGPEEVQRLGAQGF